MAQSNSVCQQKGGNENTENNDKNQRVLQIFLGG